MFSLFQNMTIIKCSDRFVYIRITYLPAFNIAVGISLICKTGKSFIFRKLAQAPPESDLLLRCISLIWLGRFHMALNYAQQTDVGVI